MELKQNSTSLDLLPAKIRSREAIGGRLKEVKK